MVEIEGTVDDGFGKVADAFQQNFAEHGELGAAFALYVDGVPRVDIWAGVADATTGRAWANDTLQLVFSTTKGAAAICVARLVEAGKISYDEPVATYWPEFGAAGKDAVTVAEMMSHRAAVPYSTPCCRSMRSWRSPRSSRHSPRRPQCGSSGRRTGTTH